MPDPIEVLKQQFAEIEARTIRECAALICKRCAKGESVKPDRGHNDYAHTLGPYSNERCEATEIWTRYAGLTVDADAPQAGSSEECVQMMNVQDKKLEARITDLQQQLDAANQRNRETQAKLENISIALGEAQGQLKRKREELDAANQRIAELEESALAFQASSFEWMRKFDTRQSVILAAEAKLADARTGIENIAARARLCLDHVGIPAHQKAWVCNEISNEERIALAQIDAPAAPTAGPSDTAVILWGLRSGSSGIKAFLKSDPARWAHGSTIAEAVGDLVMSHGEAFTVRVQPAILAEKEPQP